MPTRLNRLLQTLENRHLDALFVTSCANIYYLSGYYSSDVFLFISKKTSYILCDKRYLEELINRTDKKSFKIALIEKDLTSTLKQLIKRHRLKRIGFESENISFFLFNKIRCSLLKNSGLIPTQGTIEKLRSVKDKQEIANLTKAVHSNMIAFRKTMKYSSTGRSEHDVALLIKKLSINMDTELSFKPIVASGKSSSQPHHVASQSIIKNNAPLLIDMGIAQNHYKSDLTRTWFLGKITPNFKKLYNLVLDAQLIAISKIKPGVAFCEIDAAARNYFKKHAVKDNFLHSLGHGVGLEIHETPFVNSKNTQIVKSGMVFTVEPGLYFPNKFGIRIEDIIVVTEKGCEVLSGSLDK